MPGDDVESAFLAGESLAASAEGADADADIELSPEELRRLVEELAEHYPTDIAARPLLQHQIGVPTSQLPGFGGGMPQYRSGGQSSASSGRARRQLRQGA